MPLTPSLKPFEEKLRPEDVPPAELLKIAQLAASGAKTVSLEATWLNGEIVKSSNPDDLDEIANVQSLSRFEVWSIFPDDSMLAALLIGRSSRISAANGQAADRGRQVAARWQSLPHERRKRNIIRWAVGLLFFASMVTLAIFTVPAFSDTLVQGIMVIGFWLITTGIGWLMAASAPHGSTVAERRERWWLDSRVLLPFLVSLAGLIFSAISALKGK
jgi:hypothetical protein